MKDTYIPRYSTLPIEAYSAKAGSTWLGPAHALFLRCDAEAWNLAWLSHPFEHRPLPSDPKFSVHVRDTVAMRRPDVRSLLQREPADFWALFRAISLGTPMFANYGTAWMNLVEQRALARWRPAFHQSGLDLGQADKLLRRIASNAKL